MKFSSLLIQFKLAPKKLEKLIKLAGLEPSRTKSYSESDVKKMAAALGSPNHTYIAVGSGEQWGVRQIDYYESIKAAIVGPLVNKECMSLFSANAKALEFLEYEEIRRKRSL